MNENMSTLQKIDTIRGLLDKLSDAQGRAKCGYIFIIDDILNKVRDDVVDLQKQIDNPETISQE